MESFNISFPQSPPSLTFDYIIKNIDHPHYFAFKWILFIVMVFIEVLSCVLLGIIWHYERYGGDPQKRTILNQLTGLFAFNIFLGNLVTRTGLIFRLAYGPLSFQFALLTFSLPSMVFSTVPLLILNEIIIVRFLSAFWWKRLPPLDEKFFGLFFSCLNIGITLFFTVIGYTGGYPSSNLTFLITGLFPPHTNVVSNSILLKMFTLITACIHLMFGLPLLWKKRSLKKKQKQEVNIDGNHGESRYNNKRGSTELADNLVNSVLIVGFLVALSAGTWDWKNQVVVITSIGYIIPVFFVSVVLPSKIILSNTSIIKHVFRNN